MKQSKEARKTGRTPRMAKVLASGRKGARLLALPPECAIARASGLKSELLKRLTDSGTVRIDAKRVRRIDTATLQVLASFARDRRAAGLPVEWLGVPACLAEAAALLDLTDALNLATHTGSSVAA